MKTVPKAKTKLQPYVEYADGRKLQKEPLEAMTKRKVEEKKSDKKYVAGKQSKRLEEGPRRPRH